MGVRECDRVADVAACNAVSKSLVDYIDIIRQLNISHGPRFERFYFYLFIIIVFCSEKERVVSVFFYIVGVEDFVNIYSKNFRGNRLSAFSDAIIIYRSFRRKVFVSCCVTYICRMELVLDVKRNYFYTFNEFL